MKADQNCVRCRPSSMDEKSRHLPVARRDANDDGGNVSRAVHEAELARAKRVVSADTWGEVVWWNRQSACTRLPSRKFHGASTS